MPQPQPQTNPFEGLLTSDALRQKRLSEAMAQSGNDPNRQMFTQSLLQFQDVLRQGGIGLTKDDLRAQRNDAILKTAAQKMGERTTQGQQDPDQALASTLEESFQEMLKAGDTESAAVIAPHVYAIRARNAELDKLRADTDYVKARPELEAAKADAASARAQAAADRVEYQNNLDRARAGLADRTDPNLRGSGGSGGNTTKSTTSKFRSQGASVVSLIQNLGDIYDVFDQTPGIASQPATILSTIEDSVKGARELVAPSAKSEGYDITSRYVSSHGKDLDSAAAALAAPGESLNETRGRLESLLVDTGYSIALARNGDGRISNADLDYALKILGNARDPARVKATLLELANRSRRSFQNQAKANPDFTDEPVSGQVDEAWNALLERGKGKGPPPAKAAPGAPAAATEDLSKMTDEELRAIAGG